MRKTKHTDDEGGTFHRSIGVMGGTFDPIHYGHLVAAESAYESFSLSEVIFVPAGDPPHKTGDDVTPARHRLEMARLATEDNPHFRVSPIEVERAGLSYTIDTMRDFRDRYGSDVDLYFITGIDAILQIPEWNNTEGLFEICRFIAATRPGYSISELNRFKQQLHPEYRERIIALEVPALAISSTDLRRRVAEGRSIRYLVPDPVAEYIREQRLYRDREYRSEA
ncbi:MAG: nicotinate-nucleotide adenylyltransferase [Bacillota bacterium]